MTINQKIEALQAESNAIDWTIEETEKNRLDGLALEAKQKFELKRKAKTEIEVKIAALKKAQGILEE